MGEAHRRITEYLNRFSDAVSYQNGISLKSLFSLSSNSHFLLSLADALILFNDFNRLINQNNNYSQFSDIISPLFRSLQHYKQSNFVEAYNAFEKTAKYDSFFRSFDFIEIEVMDFNVVEIFFSVRLFRSFVIGNPRGLLKLYTLLFMKLGFLLKRYVVPVWFKLILTSLVALLLSLEWILLEELGFVVFYSIIDFYSQIYSSYMDVSKHKSLYFQLTSSQNQFTQFFFFTAEPNIVCVWFCGDNY